MSIDALDFGTPPNTSGEDSKNPHQQEESTNESANDDYQRGDVFLMLKDEPVLRYNLYNTPGRFKVYREDLLPIQLKTNIMDDDIVEFSKNAAIRNAFLRFMERRNIPLSRSNAKWLLNTLQLPQAEHGTMLTMFKCRALSLMDCYWLKIQPNDTWEELNLYNNPYANVLDEIALVRNSATRFTVQGKLKTPEYTTDGTYAKCWHRDKGEIYLYKTGTLHGKEVEAEIMSSKVADILGIKHIHYELAELFGKRCCRCKCITSENISIIPFNDVCLDYIKKTKPTHSISTMYDIEKVVKFGNGNLKDFYKMLVFDGLVCNIDRHGNNWGFYLDPATNEYKGLHILFDHNCAIDITESVDKSSSIVGDRTILDLAKYGLRYVKDDLNLKALGDYYNSREAKKDFKNLYGRLDELKMLKDLYNKVLN